MMSLFRLLHYHMRQRSGSISKLRSHHSHASSVAEYISKMKTLADKMALASKKLDDEELSSYVLVGLDFEYNPIVSSIIVHVEPINFW
jgi:hypothetical protein